MVKDHANLIRLLSAVEEYLEGNYSDLMEAFDSFSWQLEKHLFTEEKAIFTQYNPSDVSGGYTMVPELIKEHNEILNVMNTVRRDLKKKKPYLIKYTTLLEDL